VPTIDPDFNSFYLFVTWYIISAKMQKNLDSFFKPKKRSSPVPDHNPPLSHTQGSDSTATTVTERTEYVSLSKTESRQCGPPYPDIAECMNDGSLHSDIVKKSLDLLTEKWNSAFGFKFPTRCLFKKS
jgi:hypothetical protein